MAHFEVYCSNCGSSAEPHQSRCPGCSGLLSFRYDESAIQWDNSRRGMWRYRSMLPVSDPSDIVSLDEGGTPLLRSRTHNSVWFKDETRNPTGSHKDRPLSLALSNAKALRQKLSVVISAGSTGISNAAMSSRAGISSLVFAPRGTPAERLHPVQELGAQVVIVEDEIDAVVSRLAELSRITDGLYDSSTARSSNPYQSEAAKTISYEIVEQLGVPDWVVVPLGGGGTAAAIWRGFRDLQRLGRTETMPRLLGAVAENYNAFALAMDSDATNPDDLIDASIARPPTVLVKVAHVYPPDGVDGLAALKESHGVVRGVSDVDALSAQARFGREEGIYIEPSSAGCLVALDRARAEGIIRPDETVVVLLSGSGFRETFLTIKARPVELPSIRIGDMESTIESAIAHG